MLSMSRSSGHISTRGPPRWRVIIAEGSSRDAAQWFNASTLTASLPVLPDRACIAAE